MSEAVKSKQDESQLVALLLHKKVITEGQLKAALDYQKSLGGDVLDILQKLGLVRSSKVEDLLREAEVKEAAAKRNEIQVLEPSEVETSALKLHHKLLDKVPQELVAQYSIACFFPNAKTGTRKIIVGHGKPAADKILKRVQELLNVEVCSLSLEETTAEKFLDEYFKRKGVPRPKGTDAASGARGGAKSSSRKLDAPAGNPEDSGEQTSVSTEAALSPRRVEAVVNLLIKKGVIAAEELEVELRLLERQARGNNAK